jgi:C-terminal processing protease CtpA/Prc
MSKRVLAVSLLMVFIGPLIAQASPAGSKTPGWLGLSFVLHRDPPRKAWLHIRRVAGGGPAEQAGLRPQDVIVQINGKDITFASDMAALDFFAGRVAGEKIVFTLARPKGRLRLTLIAAKRPAGTNAVWQDNYTRASVPDGAAPQPRRPGQ